jgi:ABC-type transporter Mla subunit MlaD
MPAAIQAAAAIDGTLRALTLLGVDYDPDQPFDESLRSFESALSALPDGLREQSEVLRNLAPAASALGQESENLANALEQIGEDLGEIETITTAYSTTLREATVTLEETSSSLDRNTWLLRLLVVAIAVTGGALGSGLVAGGRALARTGIPTVERSVVLVND